LPIFGANLSVHQGRAGSVTAFHTNYQVRPEAGPIRARVVRRGAIAHAEAAISMQRERLPPKHRRVWFAAPGQALRIAHEVWVYSAEPLGDFLTVVDGATGKILFQENRIVFALGEALVFWPSPAQTSGDTGLQDNDDATSALLDAERVRVTLEGLDSGTGRLVGEYVDVTFGGGKIWTVADESDRIYECDRDEECFEEALVYHAVDQIQRYFHGLGFDDHVGVANGIRDFATLANPHWDEDDNSFYSTGDDAIHFGDGGVDDAEDGDIIAHEYGHAVQHDQNSCWGGGEMGAMGEGFGDYLAASFYADIGDATYQSSNAACVGEWDATSYSSDTPPCLRRVDGNKIYPTDLAGEVHDDGEIWARLLWDLRGATDGPTADKIALEHHFALPCNATMVDAANALLQADVDLNGGANAGAIRGAACERGVFTGAQCGGLSLTLSASPVPAVSAEPLTYTLTIRNDDSAIASAVLAVAVVPAGASYVGGSASDGGTEINGTVSWAAFDIAAGSSATRSFVVDVLAPGGGGVLFADDMEVGGSRWAVSHGAGVVDWVLSSANPFGGSASSAKVPSAEVGATSCAAGSAGVFACDDVDLEYFYPMASIGGGEGTDGWGWTDSATQNEYVLMGRSSGTAFVDASTPSAPVYLGNLPTHTSNSDWRDIKVYADHAFIVSEANGHGLQIFDLTQLATVASPPAVFSATAHFASFGSAHNIVINEDTAFAYIVGADTCSGGIYALDISDPVNPVYAGCFDGDGYTHDAQCVVYAGPDADYTGREICFAFNEDTITIVDVTDKGNMVQISRLGYSGSSYAHQGWLALNQRYLLVGDEGDERGFGHNTRTYVLDAEDLDAPIFVGSHTGALAAVDHNLYTKGDFVYQANYTGGLRILRMTNLASADLCEVASFDVYPDSDMATFDGAWTAYPYFNSGMVAVMSIEGLALLRPDLSDPVCAGSGEGFGQSWFAADVDDLSDQYLEISGQFLVPASAELRFWHSYNFEDGYDGGVVEVQLDGGGWTDLGLKFVDNGYSGSIWTGTSNPLAGRSAFTGASASYVLSVVDLADFEGQTAQIRFRAASDSSVGGGGWFVDDVSISSGFILHASASVSSSESATVSANAATSITGDGTEPVCGDGALGFGEFCDDAGESATCDADCTLAVCGDGHANVSAGEECDAAGSSAACDADCTLPLCGDGLLNIAAGEECDDGNLDELDGCSGLCAVEAPLSLEQRKCLQQNAIWTAKIAIGQTKENQKCTRDGSKGRLGGVSLEACPEADRRGAMLKLAGKLDQVHSTKCTDQPPFGFVDAAGMMTVLGAEAAANIETVFGDDPASALVDATDRANKPASSCQLTTQKFADKVALVMVKEFTSCVKRAAADRSDPLAGITRLTACLDAIKADSRQKVTKAVDKLAFQIGKRCLMRGVDLVQIGGDCAVGSDANVVASCLEVEMACRACAMADGAFALGADCDVFDDGVSNASCGVLR
jgi:choice-of-anchor B domain-containing protein